MGTTSPHRQFKLRIWWLALGYFAFYIPYSFLIKIVTTQALAGHQRNRFRFSPVARCHCLDRARVARDHHVQRMVEVRETS